MNVFGCIDKVLKKKIDAGETFTAYAITKEARKLTDEQFLHGDVKDYIHDELEDFVNKGKYTKTLVPSASWRAYEYSPVPQPVAPPTNVPGFQVKLNDAQAKKVAADNMFKKLAANLMALPPKIGRKTGIIKTAPLVPNSAPTPGQGAYITKQVVAKRGNRNRILVPKELIQKIGAKPRQRVNVYPVHNGKAFITQDVIANPISACYTIDCKGNFKISDSVLTNFGFTKNDNIEFCQVGNRIYIDKK